MNLKNDLVRGSLILVILFNLFNLLNYSFQFFMARMLTVADYGIFAVLMSIRYFLNVPSESVQLISSRYSSTLDNEEDLGKIRTMIAKMTQKGLIISILIYLAFIPFSFFLSWFLDIQLGLFLVAGTLIFVSFLVPINRGVLQGRKKFAKLGFTVFGEAIFKILIGVLLVLIGFRVYGAIIGVILGLLISFLLSFFLLKDIFKSKKESLNIEGIYSYSFSVFLMFFVIFFMFSIDIFLAKRFFDPDLAGKYAIASLTGKMIFFAFNPISKAMFPIVSGAEKEKSKKTLYDALKLIILFSAIVLILFYAIPEFIIKVLFGSKYLEVAGILWIVGLAYLILIISELFIYYALSFKKINKAQLFIIFPLIQVLLLSFFHSNLVEFSIALVVSFLALFIGSFLVSRH